MPKAEEIADFQSKAGKLIAFAMELMYHPATPIHFTDTIELHDERSVVRFNAGYGVRAVVVDSHIAPLIGELWRTGYHTLASCERYKDDLAYVQFPGLGWGAKALADAVASLGGKSILAPLEREAGFTFRDPHGEYGGLRFKGVTIRFDPALIEPIVNALKVDSDGHERRNFEIETYSP